MSSKIEWTNETWNPTTGCTKVSPGCAHCYAESLTKRYAGAPGWPATFVPWMQGNDTVVLHPDRLEAPLKWRTPKRVFVDSMSDLFHADVPDEFIAAVFATMVTCLPDHWMLNDDRSIDWANFPPSHIFQVLTKRPQRAHDLLNSEAFKALITARTAQSMDGIWPLPNVWLGVTVENQHFADERIPILLDTPAAVRFISAEPLLGPVRLEDWLHDSNCPLSLPFDAPGSVCICSEPREDHISWVIVGGESGSGHRPFDPDWARSIVAQCKDANVACFVKQLGGARPGNKLEDLPEDLRVREFPSVLP